MAETTTVGLDIAKSVFQVHGVDADGAVVLRKQVRREALLIFLPVCRAVWLAWRRAGRRTIGLGSWVRWGTRFG